MLSDLLKLLKEREYLVIPVVALIGSLIVANSVATTEFAKDPWAVVLLCFVVFIVFLAVLLVLWYMLGRRQNRFSSSPLTKTEDFKASPGILFLPKRDLLMDSYKVGLMKESRQVDMLGWNLYRSFFQVTEYVDTLRSRLVEGEDSFRLRILLPEASSPFQKALLADREAYGKRSFVDTEISQAQLRYESTIGCLKSLLGEQRLPEMVRFVKRELILSGIVRFDHAILLTLYRSRSRGSSSLLVVLHENAKASDARMLFAYYKEAFEYLWEQSK